MEDNIQTIIVVIISAFLLFIFPVYMAYEKKDDISYALAMRYTEDLVDEVRSKGYITKYMYDDYKARLKVTGNSYDISLTHEYTRFDPVTNYYNVKDNKRTLVKTTTQIEKENLLQDAIKANNFSKENLDNNEELAKFFSKQFNLEIKEIEDTYKESTEVFSTDHILGVLATENKLALNVESTNIRCVDNGEYECQYAYTMNEGDTFNVTIKNTNTTLATVIYNMITANQLDNNTRIYVNYGGKILSNKWYGNIDYSKMKHDNLSYTILKEISIKAKTFPADITKDMSQEEIAIVKDILPKEKEETFSNYAIEFEAKPEAVTELRDKGYVNKGEYDGYNFVLGNGKAYKDATKKNIMSVSVGLNGITVVGSNVNEETTIVNNTLELPTYIRRVERERTVKEEYTYIDEETGEEKVAYRDKIEKYIEEIPTKRTLDEYEKAEINYVNSKVRVRFYGKAGVGNFTQVIDVIDNANIALLNGLNLTVDLANGSASIDIGEATSLRGTKIRCTATIGTTGISVTAIRYNVDEQTLLSYPVEIEDFEKIRIEVRNGVVSLVLDDVKVAEGIKLNTNPEINYIGGTLIGSNLLTFKGQIRNVKLYKLR